MLTRDIITAYLNAILEGIKQDATAKGQKIPVSSFRIVVTDESGELIGADYFKYLVKGRGPGKFPPPDKMLEAVRRNPQMLDDARAIYENITEKNLAFLIGRKIAREGTDIYKGKKPGIDLQGAIDGPKENFLQQLAYYETLNIATKLRAA